MIPVANGVSDDPVTEELFRETYDYQEDRRVTPLKAIAQQLKCTKQTALNIFQIGQWLPKYSVKNDLLGDVIAGITVAIMHIPHGLSYAPLGRAEPVVGLYMAIFPVFVYIFMGTSRQISIGTFAVVCAMVGEIANEWAPTAAATGNGSESESHGNETQFGPIEVGTAVCFLVGLWQSLLGLLKLGILLVVMSNSLISGFTTGAACYVFTYQLKSLFGVNVLSFKGILKLFYLYIDFFSKIKTTNLVTLALSLSAITILLFFNEFLKPLISKRYPQNKIPVPIELIVIVLGILVSHFGQLSENYDVKTVKHIPGGLPGPQAPPFSLLPPLVLPSFVVAVVALATNLSLAKIFAKKSNYSVSNNQELLAYGSANLVSSFFLCLPSAASLSRSSIQFSTGGRTQLASAFSVVLVILVVVFAGPLFEPVPYCVLSAVVVVTLKSLLMQFFDLPKIWRASRWDGIVWLGTFMTVVILDIDVGLCVGVALSVLSMTCTSLLVHVNVLGRVPETNVVLDIRRYGKAVAIPKMVVLQIVGNINYGNCYKLEEKILKELKGIEEESFVVLNLDSVVRVDPTTLDTLISLQDHVSKRKCQLYLTNCNAIVYATMENCNFFKIFPRNRLFARVENAIAYLSKIAL